MNRNLVLSVLFFSGMFLVGCGDAKVESVDLACPDLALEIQEAILSEALGNYGQPSGESATFSTDHNEIFLTISLTDDMCCRALNVRWFDPQGEVLQWEEKIMPSFPNIVSLKAPSTGFAPGAYKVVIYIDFWEKLTLPFWIN